MSLDPLEVSDAIVAWTGWGASAWPARDDDRVVKRFGKDRALDLLPAIHRLETQFYESDAKDTVENLGEMGDVAAARFRGLNPEISEDAVRALAVVLHI